MQDSLIVTADFAGTPGVRPPVAPGRWLAGAIVFGAACITFGILWDISWHTTIGRDTFWTPAHLLIYLGGVLGGCLGGWTALSATFWRRREMWGSTVGILGFRAPLGAWVAMWGAGAMLTSAPFDDWWHNAYGLDVKILSPPHAVLAFGMYGVMMGAVLLAASERNRREAAGDTGGVALVLLAGGIQMALASVLVTEVSFPNLQHTQTFFIVSAALYPTFFAAVSRHCRTGFPATTIALIYVAVIGTMVWLLPLFPAEPRLAPIYHRVTHMTPPAFPLLLVVPALAIDFWNRGARRWWGDRRLGLWLRVAGAAVLFVACFLPVQWYFSRYLISPDADNAFFAGSRFMGYTARHLPWGNRFWRLTEDPVSTATVGWMLLTALVSSVAGTAVGEFLRRVRR